MILVMLRGRHRGLPVAIDRAIMLPREYARLDRRSATVDPSEVRRSAQTGTSGRRGTVRSGDGVAEKSEGRGYGRIHGHGNGQSR